MVKMRQKLRGLRARWAGQAGQSTTEYMLVISVIAVMLYYSLTAGLGFGDTDSKVKKSFDRFQRTVVAPYP